MNAAEPRVAVVGAGAIGGWIAAQLALSGVAVGVLARGETLRLLRSEGLRIGEGDTFRTAQVLATDDPAQLAVQDLVVIAVKAPALPALAPLIRELVGPETLIVPMLNGVPWWFADGQPLQTVDPQGVIAAAMQAERILGSVVHAACSRAAPNHVVVKKSDKLILGEPQGGSAERVAAVCALFDKAGIACEQSADVRRAIWYKLWGNATVNPLSALTRAPADRLLGDPVLRAFMAEAMAELAQIGAAIGCALSQSSEERMAVTARLGSFKPSMLQDVEAGRQIELEALVGAPREIAGRHGIATPALDHIYAMTRLLGESLKLL